MRILIILIMTVLVFNVYGQDTQALEEGLPSISKEDYFKSKTQSDNASLDLPSLGYPGYKDIAWGSSSGSISKSLSNSLNESSNLLGISALIRPKLNKTGDQVNGLNFISSLEEFSSRREKFIAFTRTKNKLLDRYGPPTHHLLPEQTIEGKDAFILGLVDKYHLEWQGKETMIKLLLTEDKLELEFSKSNYSDN